MLMYQVYKEIPIQLYVSFGFYEIPVRFSYQNRLFLLL
nr:MAG TPA: hypothetical protein [Caudoviricetes sp.]